MFFNGTQKICYNFKNMINSLPEQFKSVLDTDEKILWQGKPVFIPFFATGLPFFFFGILWGVMDYGFIKQSFFSTQGTLNYTMVPFFLLHLAPLWLGTLNLVRSVLAYHNVSYVITNKRVILRSGFWGIDFAAIDYDKINDMVVTVNPLEQMFGVGTIRIDSGRTTSRGVSMSDAMIAIKNPYEVFKTFKTTTVNIKTDWNYPNKLRPAENPGYKTKYKPKE